MRPLSIGDVTVEAVVEVAGPRIPADMLLPTAGREQITAHAVWMAPGLYVADTHMFAMVRQSYVVRTPHRTILIDTCVGEHKDRTNERFRLTETPWPANFRALGLAYEDIDVVMCTHLHVDHVGWNTRLENGRWVPTFPNARYLFGRTEMETYRAAIATSPDPEGPIYDDSILPVVDAGQAEIVADDHELADGLWFELTPGHTPGHVCVHLQNAGGHAVFSGDLMHHPIQVREPQWNSCFCADAEQAQATRRAFLERHADSDTMIVPAHFERGTVGRLESTADGFTYLFRDGGSTRAPPG